jgi:release factor glutamine methyltransferase
MATTIADAVQAARRRLERAGIPADEAALDADVLARHALRGWERAQLLARMRDTAPQAFQARFEALVSRRERREPCAYVTGVREFWGLEFEVGPGVLVPRPETELVVEEVLARLEAPRDAAASGRLGAPQARRFRLADVGTGSGCLAVALARALPSVFVVAADLAREAAAVVARNAARHGVSDRVCCVAGDLLEPLAGAFDVIVSNPPYVPSGALATLQPEIRNFEPRHALDGGPDGLDIIRRLVPQAAARLRPGGWLVFEFGDGQADAVRTVFASQPALSLVTLSADLAGILRVAVARRMTPP